MEKKVLRLNKGFEYLRSIGMVHTQADVAKAMGASRPNVSSALKGDGKVLTDKFLKTLCERIRCLVAGLAPDWRGSHADLRHVRLGPSAELGRLLPERERYRQRGGRCRRWSGGRHGHGPAKSPRNDRDPEQHHQHAHGDHPGIEATDQRK